MSNFADHFENPPAPPEGASLFPDRVPAPQLDESPHFSRARRILSRALLSDMERAQVHAILAVSEELRRIANVLEGADAES